MTLIQGREARRDMMLRIRDEQMKVFEQTALRNFGNEDAAFTSIQGREISIDRTLKIRDEQMKVFEQAALRSFEDEMVKHIKQFAIKHSEIIGDQGVREVVRMGIERAKKHGLTNRGPVRFYIELMFMLGSDFDTDPQYPWAGEILNDPGIVDQMERADRLYDKAMNYVEKVAGPEYKYEEEALRRVTQMRFEDLPDSDEKFASDIIGHLKRIYPQKIEYVGELALNILIQQGNELAKSHAISTTAGAALIVGLMFAFGHGCFTDPQFPWIAGTLSNTSVIDLNKKVERLYSRMMTFLDNALPLIEKR